ncbi:hypothetical protein [Conexibacter sp. CPCC 206217]|uniref:hypothetical protein n=1 Tax=Conexibacter sp. CPCC 206217 TaxID=3064574 RepID=UPI002715EC8A|nr:hypothetical protein [Conexibacter sp. CPCC 206217]MDO8213896.1 hypothetical protein [Conexibacter sp. CPCC 206217]
MMRATTVRFGGGGWTWLKARAERDGISKAQYIREATLMRLAADEAAERLAREYFESLVRERYAHAFATIHRRLRRLELLAAGTGGD